MSDPHGAPARGPAVFTIPAHRSFADALVAGLRALGAEAEEWPDGFRVSGLRPLRGGAADAAGDHRLAMAFAVAALGASGPSSISGAGSVDISYPGFFEMLASLAG